MGELGALGGLFGNAALSGLIGNPYAAGLGGQSFIPWQGISPSDDPNSPDFDKAQWDVQFERECGYLPDRSPVAAYRALRESFMLDQRALTNALQAPRHAVPYVAFEEVL